MFVLICLLQPSILFRVQFDIIYPKPITFFRHVTQMKKYCFVTPNFNCPIKKTKKNSQHQSWVWSNVANYLWAQSINPTLLFKSIKCCTIQINKCDFLKTYGQKKSITTAKKERKSYQPITTVFIFESLFMCRNKSWTYSSKGDRFRKT